MSKVLSREVGEMAELSKACTILAEASCSVPSIPHGWFTKTNNSNSRESDALIWLLLVMYLHAQHRHIYSHIKVKMKICVDTNTTCYIT